jgi:hypothetical protein
MALIDTSKALMLQSSAAARKTAADVKYRLLELRS